MQYKPSASELLEAISEFLRKDILTVVKENDKLSYKTLVSWNMINVLMREVEKEEEILIQEISELSKLLKKDVEIPLTMKEKREKLKELLKFLIQEIQNQKISSQDHPYWKFTKEFLKNNLNVSNPRYFT